MKKGFLKISALIMATILLFSTLTLTVQMHICAGEVADVAVFGNLESCTIHDIEKENSLSSFNSESCCQDSSQFLRGSNAELKTSNNSHDDIVTFTVVFLYSYFNSFELLDKSSDIFNDYSPPNVTKDISILYETFLI